MASISSPGVGSGLDISSLVSQLVAAERRPTQLRLDRREASLQAELSAFGTLKGSLSSFQSALSGLQSLSSFQARTASSSNSDAFTASASTTAAEGVYNISVTTLAKAHSLATSAGTFSSLTDTVGTGTITIKFGTTDYDSGTDTYNSFTQNTEKAAVNITIDSSNDTLEGVRDAINDADADVRASIVNDGSGYRLVLTSKETGAENSLQVTIDDTGDGDDTDASGLSRLAFNASATNLDQTAAASDAAVSIDGIDVTSSSNTIDDAIEGVTLNLLDTQSGTLTVDLDKAKASSNISSFVSSYNSLVSTINNLTAYDADTQKAAILLGDTATRTVESRVRGVLGDVVEGLGGPFQQLADIGITLQTDGTLLTDSTKLQEALDENYDDVAGLFVAQGTPTDSLINFDSSTEDTKVGSYAIQVDQLATQGLINGQGTATLADDGAGNFNSPVVIDGDNDEFTVKVDSIQSQTISLTQGSYTTTASLAAEIQTQINGDSALQDAGVAVSVSFDASNDRFVITSNRYGSASKVEITAVDTNTEAELGLASSLTGTDGQDVEGSIGGVIATGSGRFLTGSGDASGLKVEVTGGSTGSRGTISFTRGYADQLNTTLSELLEDDGLLDNRTDGINDSIADIGDQRDSLERRLDALEQRLLAQFSALDALVSRLQSTSDFLTQQLANLPGSSPSGGS